MIRPEGYWSRSHPAFQGHFGMGDFRNLVVWQKANKLSAATAEAVEHVTGNAGSILRRQLLRSTFSIQSNIAEGSAKRSDKEFARYVRIALGSSTESANHLILMHDLALLDDDCFSTIEKKQNEVGKMLSGLEKRLRGNEESPHSLQF